MDDYRPPVVKTTKNYGVDGMKFLVYGQAGIGKTCLCASMPNPIIISAESGLLSLSALDLPYIEVKSFADLSNAYNWLVSSEEAKGYDSVCIDSISEVGEVILAHEKENNTNLMRAYGNLLDQVDELVKAFRDLPGKHVYMSAKVERVQDETGMLLYSPNMPGKQLPQRLPYLFDGIFHYQIVRNQNGDPKRWLLTQPDGKSQAKDRSGKLDMWEQPDLGAIINKIRS